MKKRKEKGEGLLEISSVDDPVTLMPQELGVSFSCPFADSRVCLPESVQAISKIKAELNCLMQFIFTSAVQETTNSRCLQKNKKVILFPHEKKCIFIFLFLRKCTSKSVTVTSKKQNPQRKAAAAVVKYVQDQPTESDEEFVINDEEDDDYDDDELEHIEESTEEEDDDDEEEEEIAMEEENQEDSKQKEEETKKEKKKVKAKKKSNVENETVAGSSTPAKKG